MTKITGPTTTHQTVTPAGEKFASGDGKGGGTPGDITADNPEEAFKRELLRATEARNVNSDVVGGTLTDLDEPGA